MLDQYFEFNISTYLFLYVTSAIIIYLFQLLFKELFISRKEKRKREELIEILKLQRVVCELNNKFKQIDFFERKNSLFYGYVGLFFGGLVPLTVMYIYISFKKLNLETDLTERLAFQLIFLSFSITFLFSFLSLLVMKNYLDLKVKESEFLEKFVFIANIYTGIEFYTCGAFLLSIIFVPSILSNFSDILTSQISTFLFVFVFTLIIATPFTLKVEKRKFRSNLKNILNSIAERKMPDLCVTTKFNSRFKGKIKDIFNDQILILEDEGNKKAVLWESICAVEFYEKKAIIPEKQRSLSEYL